MPDHKPDTLEDHGILYLTGPITPGSSEALAREILLVNLKGRHQRLQLIVNPPGGDVGAGFAMLDVPQWSAVPIKTVNLGQVASMGLLVLIAVAWRVMRNLGAALALEHRVVSNAFVDEERVRQAPARPSGLFDGRPHQTLTNQRPRRRAP
ncbi:MAG: ATP-dependent Clp protease proteolytic subunit [Deltaproteobacteria bacterium]|nr:ATP-dependent Clp protease proteolytic subunit [Deltaproteobacteria bacterium]